MRQVPAIRVQALRIPRPPVSAPVAPRTDRKQPLGDDIRRNTPRRMRSGHVFGSLRCAFRGRHDEPEGCREEDDQCRERRPSVAQDQVANRRGSGQRTDAS